MTERRKPAARPASGMRFARIKDLRSGDRVSPAETMKRMCELLSSSNIKGTFRLRIVEGESVADAPVFSVNLGGPEATKAKAGAKAATKSTVEVITTSQTWSDIASGRLAPHDAFLGGHMRVRGSVGLAQRLLKHLAADEGLTFICREEG